MEEKDIVPQLLEQLQRLFKTAKGRDKRIEALLEKALAGEAAYPDADEFAARVGEALAAAFREGLSADTLPEGRLWWNIADRAVRPLLEEGYKEGADFAGAVQESLNKKANIGLKVQTSPADRDRIDGILNMAAAAERYDLKAAELEDAAVNLVQHAVTDTLRRNVESHARVGLSPRIIRRAEGRACKWCRSLAGTYAYPDVPEDVYRRHEHCRCTVEYDPRTGKTQNVHTKEWTGKKDYDILKSRKSVGLLTTDKRRYEDDIIIPLGVGAKQKDIFVELPTKEKVILTPGSRITHVETIAGRGRNRKIDIVDLLIGTYPGTDAAKWQKKKGIGYVDYHGESYKVELHWYEEPSVGRVEFKIKPDAAGNWFYEDE